MVQKVRRGGQILWYTEVTFHFRRRGGRRAAGGGGGWVVRVGWQKEGVCSAVTCRLKLVGRSERARNSSCHTLEGTAGRHGAPAGRNPSVQEQGRRESYRQTRHHTAKLLCTMASPSRQQPSEQSCSSRYSLWKSTMAWRARGVVGSERKNSRGP